MDFSRPDLTGPRPAPFQAPQGDLAILAGNANPLLAQNIANTLGVALTPARAHVFSEGNVFVRIKENVRGKDVFVIQGCHYPVNDNFMELLFWIDAARRASAQNVTAVIPFFSYAQGDKKDEPRVSIRARVCADAIRCETETTSTLCGRGSNEFSMVSVMNIFLMSLAAMRAAAPLESTP